jgi:hypothetical protein
MYPQMRLVTSVRGIGELPTTLARVADGVIGLMNAAFGWRLAAFFAGAFLATVFFIAFLAGAFLATVFFAGFLAAFFFVAIVFPPVSLCFDRECSSVKS